MEFKNYYIGRRGLYHNKSVVILNTNYDIIEYQDFGLDFNNFEIVIYYLDGTKTIEKLKGNQINKHLILSDIKKKQ